MSMELTDEQVAWYAGTSRTARWTPDMSIHENIVILASEVQRWRALDAEWGEPFNTEMARKLDAIDALHQPSQRIYCTACMDRWPCGTHRILHPEEAKP